MKSRVLPAALLLFGSFAACSTEQARDLDDDDGIRPGTSSSGGSSGQSGASSSGSSSSGGGSSGGESSSSSGGGSSSGESSSSSGGSSSSGSVPPGPTHNVVVNGSFEQWDGGKAIGWHGAATHMDGLSVREDSAAAHDGLRSANLNVSTASHRRFSTEPRPWAAGRYQCSYWVRGQGQVRNARFSHDDYSSYSSYTTIDGNDWQRVNYSFQLAAAADDFELVFSVQSTAGNGLLLDDVVCEREVEPCDDVQCESWQQCEQSTRSCVTAPGFCGVDAECPAHKSCNVQTNSCELREGRCDASLDCGDPSKRCDLPSHTCVAGDPCSGVVCAEWRSCNPNTVACELSPGRCEAHSDCPQASPVCNKTTRACEALSSPINVVPNGSFETWEPVTFGNSPTEYLLPTHWYGVADGGAYVPESEIVKTNVRRYTQASYDGQTAAQLIVPGNALRFTTEKFTVKPGKQYDCAFRARGKGSVRARGYCAAWNPDTQFTAIDSDDWTTIPFSLTTQSSWCTIVLYPSRTDASRDHLQVDGVACTER